MRALRLLSWWTVGTAPQWPIVVADCGRPLCPVQLDTPRASKTTQNLIHNPTCYLDRVLIRHLISSEMQAQHLSQLRIVEVSSEVLDAEHLSCCWEMLTSSDDWRLLMKVHWHDELSKEWPWTRRDTWCTSTMQQYRLLSRQTSLMYDNAKCLLRIFNCWTIWLLVNILLLTS